MFAQLAVVLFLSNPDAGAMQEAQEMARQLWIETEADLMLGDPAKQQLVLSAMICEAEQRKHDTDRRMEAILPNKALVRASASAMSDITDFQTKLVFLGKERLACTYFDVAVLAVCLGPVDAGSKICSSSQIQVEESLAARLAKGPPPASGVGLIPAKKKASFVDDSWGEPGKLSPFANILWPFPKAKQ
jgi:hypothetical protein